LTYLEVLHSGGLSFAIAQSLVVPDAAPIPLPAWKHVCEFLYVKNLLQGSTNALTYVKTQQLCFAGQMPDAPR